MKRHLIIPDTQISPGVPLDHLDHAARAVLEYRPTSLHIMGDWWDMHSLSSHDRPGSKQMEGARYRDDVDAGNEAMERFLSPLGTARGLWGKRITRLYRGNHEHRITRAIANEPKFDGAISLDHLEARGVEIYDFLEPVCDDGVWYSHFWQHLHSAGAIGGEITRMLALIGDSFIAGHVQGLKMGNRTYPTGKTRHGIVAGSFYQHDEKYRGPQGRTKNHWNGIVVLNDVRDGGNFEPMPLSIDFLKRRFGGKRK
jgi:hypothetical protein